ncbi:unnamed protein product [Heligmosomoides polygyrus]|uniref:BACK domain-containing protein n=1 Tax=Heligmosomoides polygyrus TaxID=6339 RepID=A0A183G1S9_HELPZ|nr:unnamed protein product [Heligmosomoides polygyrus]
MLYGGMKESVEAEHELRGTNILAFRTILRFIYCGKVDLHAFKHGQLLEILRLSHDYRLTSLQQAVIEYLKTKLNINNVFVILGTSTLLQLKDLTEYCLRFADENASKVLVAKEFVTLPLKTVMQVLSRDSFCVAQEIHVFHAMCKWIQAQPVMEATPLEMLIKSLVSKNCLRLHLMSRNELLTTVRNSPLFEANWPTFDVFILDAMGRKNEGTATGFRGSLLADKNVATLELGAAVVSGINTGKLLSRVPESPNIEVSVLLTHHRIGKKEGIIVKLGRPYTINTIVLQQPKWQVESGYSCDIEVRYSPFLKHGKPG